MRFGGTLVLPALTGLGACVTTEVVAPDIPAPVEALPVVVPLRAVHDNRPADQYYVDILRQMQEAFTENDSERLQGLLARHDRSHAPAWAHQRLQKFRGASRGLAFATWAAERSAIVSAVEDPPIGAPVDYTVAIAVLRGDVEPLPETSFLVSLSLVDFDPFGSRSDRSSSRVVRPDEGELFEGRWELPFAADLAAGNSVIRQVRVRVEVLPGLVEIDGQVAPLPRMVVAEREDLLFPAGIEPIRGAPLRTLRNALSLGDEAHFPHQFLASYFMPAEQRDAAVELLMPKVRLGNPGQARVAMAGLRMLTGEEMSVEDRAGWLAWWQDRNGD